MPDGPQPRTKRGRATRQRIVRAAGDLVGEQGLANVSLDDVCARAEASKSQLYLYFSDREALVREVSRDTCDLVMAAQAEVLAGFDTWAGITAYLDATVALQVQREARGGCPIGTLAGQVAEHDTEARLALADGYARWETGLRAGLERMADQGGLRPDADPARLAAQTLALLQGGLVLTQVRRDPQQIRIAADAVLALIGAALRLPPGDYQPSSRA